MYPQYHQMTLDDYDFPFGKLDPENEWVKLAALVPWDVAEEEYAKQFVNNGHPAHPVLRCIHHGGVPEAFSAQGHRSYSGSVGAQR